MGDKDPLSLGGLEPTAISSAIEAKSKTKVRPPNELDLKKEERLLQKESRLNTGRAGGSSAPAPRPEEPPPPPPVDPTAILDRIVAYRERFPELKSRNKLGPKCTVDELVDELHYIELQLGSSKGGGSLGANVLVGIMTGAETVTRDHWNPLNLSLQGLGSVTKDNIGEFEPIVDELMIKYGAGMYMSPELRLMMLIGSTVLTVHMANSGDPRIAEALKKMNRQAKEQAGSKDL